MVEKDQKNHTQFDIQLDFLKIELEHLMTGISNIDEITQKIKNWTILLWGGSVALILGNEDGTLKPFLYFTCLIPLLFWLIDAWWRQIQRTMIFRSSKISSFLNGPDLLSSIESHRFINMTSYDLRSKEFKNTKELNKHKNLLKVMFFFEIAFFYLGLIITSLVITFFLNPNKMFNLCS